MKPNEQTKALAELDGRECCCKGGLWDDTHGDLCCELHADRPRYLTSYDAIIPLIQKLWKAGVCLSGDFTSSLKQVRDWYTISLIEMLTATPSQLCEALLRATSKWKD